MKVGIAFDLQPVSGPPADGPDDRFEEFDKPETVDAIAEVIRGEGHEVVLLGDGRPFLERVLADPPDFVWNIAEGEGVGRCREARVPAALEMLGIPYSGSDPLTLGICLDKGTTRQVLDREAIGGGEVPWGMVIPPDLWANEDDRIPFFQSLLDLARDAKQRRGTGEAHSTSDSAPLSLILKPAFEGSSKGIRGQVIAQTAEDLSAIHHRMTREYRQPVVVEEFIEGDELTVGVCGNGVEGIEVLGIMRVVPNRPDPRFVYSLEMKRDWINQVQYETPARLTPQQKSDLESASRFAYVALGCRDFARIDFRLAADGTPYLIEVNPLPGLAPVTSDLVILAEGYGLSHADLIRKLFRISLERNGLLR